MQVKYFDAAADIDNNPIEFFKGDPVTTIQFNKLVLVESSFTEE